MAEDDFRLTEENKEKIRRIMEALDEIAEEILPPVDPRVSGLLIIASDMLNQQLEMDISYSEGEHNHDDEEGNLEVIRNAIDEIIKPHSSIDYSKVQQKMLFLLEEPDIEPPSLPGKTLGEKMADDISKWFDELDAGNGAF